MNDKVRFALEQIKAVYLDWINQKIDNAPMALDQIYDIADGALEEFSFESGRA